jgi:hypothetical protein
MPYDRNIRLRSRFLFSGTSEPNSYLTKVAKGIPAEIVGVYLTLIALLNDGPIAKEQLFFWGLFIVCLILTPIYLKKIYKVVDNLQLLASSIAFIVWSMAIGGPFDFLYEHARFLGAFLTPLVSLAIPLLLKDEINGPYKNE